MTVLVRHHVSGQTRCPQPGPGDPAEPAGRLVQAAGLRILATGVWPDAGPAGSGATLPGVAGFIVSSFNPLVIEAARRAMMAHHSGSALPAASQPPAASPRSTAPDPRPAPTTAVIVVSAYADAVSAAAVADAVDAGGRVGPLMFFQSVPNAVAGHVAAHWRLTGPVIAISPVDDALADGMAEGIEVARLLIADGDADRALLIFAEQATHDDAHDRAVAVLVESISGTGPEEQEQ